MLKPAPTEESAFVRRFETVRMAVLRMRMVQGVCWSLVFAGGSLTALAVADYVAELPWDVRATGLAAAIGMALTVATVGVVRPLLWWSRPRTAKELEAQFPQLGQRVRTVVQFTGRDALTVSGEGVEPALVAALEDETDLQSQPLDLRQIVPRRQVVVAVSSAVVMVVLLVAGLLVDWQWRLAVARALLSDRPYTTIAVEPGDVLLDLGRDVTLGLTLEGRIDRRVTLRTRKADDTDAPWQAQELSAGEVCDRSPDGRRMEYAVTLDKVTDPLDYQFSGDLIQDSLHHIRIRYPLAMKTFEATLTPPSYTGLASKAVDGGDLDVNEGSHIRLLVDFDRESHEAYLLVSDPPRAGQAAGEPSPAVRVPLEPSPDGFTATLRPDSDKFYSVVATAREGGSLPDNRYRIRVRKDQSPHVRFEDPPEAWEANPIAEVLVRIRVDDDFGVSKAGIVLQIDNGEEQELLAREYSISVQPDADGDIHLTTRAVPEELLCLDEFDVTENSAVTYYAYVEDNYPDEPKRTETDLRFIEIRPFQRIYMVAGT